jgi:hypothetical protein
MWFVREALTPSALISRVSIGNANKREPNCQGSRLFRRPLPFVCFARKVFVTRAFYVIISLCQARMISILPVNCRMLRLMTDFGEKVRREKQAVIRKPLVKSPALHCLLVFLSHSPNLAMSRFIPNFTHEIGDMLEKLMKQDDK